MQQHIAAANHLEDALKFFRFDRAILQLCLLGAGQGRGGAALVGLVLELG